MKKGLFSILAGALLVVGCQNYDDQFDNIETLVNALAQQVAGLSKVQADLTTLAGTVNALQDNIGTEVDSALAAGLEDIAEATATLNAAAGTAASSEDVAAIAAAVAAQQSDLADILAASQFFTGDLTVNNVADLTTYHNARAGFKIINGNVTINSTSDMDMVKLQELVDAIAQTSEDFAYNAGTGVTTEITFNNLTSTRSLTLDQEGGYKLQTLTNATNISLDYHNTVTIVDLRALKTVVTLKEETSAAGAFHFKKATEIHLTSLPYYTNSALSIQGASGGVIDITALRDVDVLGAKAALVLTLDGPTTVDISNLTGDYVGSSISLVNVTNATINGYDGTINLGAKVSNFTSNNVVNLGITGTALESFTATGILDPNATTADLLGPALDLDAQKVTTVTLAGLWYSVDIQNNGSLETVVISGTVQNDIDLDTNSDLATVTLTGSTCAGIIIDTNESLEALTVNTTFAASVSSKGVANAKGINGKVSIIDNIGLTSLTVSSDKIEDLTITGNDELATLDFTGAATIGAEGKAIVLIQDNDLTATKFTDTADVVTTPAAAIANGGVSDIGTIASTSGMATLKTYLAAVKADADSTANVYFDTVDTFIPETVGATAIDDQTWDATKAAASPSTLPDAIKVLVLTANTADLGDAVTTSKRSFILTPAAQKLGLVINGIDVLEAAVDNAQLLTNVTSVTLNLNQSLSRQSILDAATIALADVAGVSIAITEKVSAKILIGFGANGTGGQNSRTLVAGYNPAFNIAVSDVVTISLGGTAAKPDYSVTVSGTAYDGLPANILAFSEAIKAKWNSNYVTGLVKSATAVKWAFSSVSDAFGGDLTSPTTSIVFTAKDKGSPAVGTVARVSITTASNVNSNLGYIIGNDNSKTNSTADDIAEGLDMMITITADTAGATLSEIGLPAGTLGIGAGAVNVYYAGTGPTELTSSYKPNIATGVSAVSTALNIYPTESRTDVIVGEELNAPATSNAVSFSRVGWL